MQQSIESQLHIVWVFELIFQGLQLTCFVVEQRLAVAATIYPIDAPVQLHHGAIFKWEIALLLQFSGLPKPTSGFALQLPVDVITQARTGSHQPGVIKEVARQILRHARLHQALQCSF